MPSSELKLKTGQTELIIFDFQIQLKKLDFYLPVWLFFIRPAIAIKNLGVWLDAKFTFANHVYIICKICSVQSRDLRGLRQLLAEGAILVANPLFSSRLGYCNSLFRCPSNLNMCNLQCIEFYDPLVMPPPPFNSCFPKVCSTSKSTMV